MGIRRALPDIGLTDDVFLMKRGRGVNSVEEVQICWYGRIPTRERSISLSNLDS